MTVYVDNAAAGVRWRARFKNHRVRVCGVDRNAADRRWRFAGTAIWDGCEALAIQYAPTPLGDLLGPMTFDDIAAAVTARGCV